MKISVCIGTYNGEKFLLKQLESILYQLSADDEVIVVDDCSKDRTIEILKSIKDDRIKIFINDKNRGHVYSFGRSISLANHDVIFMADQDDVWIAGRVELMKKELLSGKGLLVSSNSGFIDVNGNPLEYYLDGVHSVDSDNYLKNILAIFTGKTNYYGCAMAFSKRLNEVILPIPEYVESHDLWIAMAGNLLKANVHLDEETFNRRIHGNNASIVNRGLFAKLRSRWIFAKSLFEISVRIRRSKLLVD